MSSKKYTGINIQYPISQDILSGRKVIETRTYPIPKNYINEELLLVETPGKDGGFKARAVAIIVFSGCKKYSTKTEFYSDFEMHLVDKSSKWSWSNKPKWGWLIGMVEILEKPVEIKKKKGIIYTKDIVI